MESINLTYAFRKGYKLNFYEADKEGNESLLKEYHSYHFDKIFIPRVKDKVIIDNWIYKVKSVSYCYDDIDEYFLIEVLVKREI